MANTTWNPSDKEAHITLSGGNLIATGTAGWTSCVRAVASKLTGKYYWEATFNTATTALAGVGLSTGFAALNGGMGSGTSYGMVSLGQNGSVYRGLATGGSSAIATGWGTITNGTVICVAADLNANSIWFRYGAAGNWNNNVANNPATGVGGIALSGSASAYYPVAGFGAADQITGNFGDSVFTGAAPAGFTSGWPTGSALLIAADTQTALEEWMSPVSQAQLTQVALEQWGLTGSVGTRAVATQVALEEWAKIAAVAARSKARAMVLA